MIPKIVQFILSNAAKKRLALRKKIINAQRKAKEKAKEAERRAKEELKKGKVDITGEKGGKKISQYVAEQTKKKDK